MNDKVSFKYTVDGKVAQRTDQRDVVLDYFYERWGKLGDVKATIPPGSDVDNTIAQRRFLYDNRGRVYSAFSKDPYDNTKNSVHFTYDTFGNLKADIQPINNIDNINDDTRRTTEYTWEWVDLDETGGPLHHNRLTGIIGRPWGCPW